MSSTEADSERHEPLRAFADARAARARSASRRLLVFALVDGFDKVRLVYGGGGFGIEELAQEARAQ